MADPYVGEIRMFAGNYAPMDWKFCNGDLISISGNEVLYSLIGTTYGGDGQTTFALPDLRGRVPINQGDHYVAGQRGGVETVTLTESELPVHSHSFFVEKSPGTDGSPHGKYLATSPNVLIYRQAPPTVPMAKTAIMATGGGGVHENMMPFLCVNFIISMTGIYPYRS